MKLILCLIFQHIIGVISQDSDVKYFCSKLFIDVNKELSENHPAAFRGQIATRLITHLEEKRLRKARHRVLRSGVAALDLLSPRAISRCLAVVSFAHGYLWIVYEMS